MQHQAIEDVLKFVDLDESQKANLDMLDAILKSDTTSKAKDYIEAISDEKFDSFIDEFRKENIRHRLKLKDINSKISKIKHFAKFYSSLLGIDKQKIISYKNLLLDKLNISLKL